jgi:hypothetical protein
MNLTECDLQVALRCVSELLDTRRLLGAPIPAWLVEHHRRVAAAYRGIMSTVGQGTVTDTAQSGHEFISARQAADIIGLSRRQIQRIGADLDGRIVDGRWLYPLNTVREYAEGRQQH